MSSDVQICNIALVGLGATPIASFDEKNDRARICARMYPFIRDGILSMDPWRFQMAKANLTRSSEVPVNDWKYYYQLPPDRMSSGPLAVYDTTQVGADPVTQFEIFGQLLAADYELVIIDYAITRTDPEQFFPHWFEMMLAACVKAHIAFAITHQQNVADEARQIAYGTPAEGGRGGMFGDALATNTLGNSNVQHFNSDELIAFRNAGA